MAELRSLQSDVETVAATLQAASTATSVVVGDQLAPVLSTFLPDARGEATRLVRAVGDLESLAQNVCRFYCEEDLTVPSAHALLKRLHAFGSALSAAHG